MESRPTTASSDHPSHTSITLELPSTIKPLSSALVVGEAGQQYQPPHLHPDLLAPPRPIHPMYHFQNYYCCSVTSCVRLFVTPWTAAHQASLSFTISQSLLKLMSIESVMPSHPLSPPSPPALNLSQHQGLFTPGGQSIGASASASVLPVNIQSWFPLGWTGLIPLLSKDPLQCHNWLKINWINKNIKGKKTKTKKNT